MLSEKEVMKELVKEYGRPTTVVDLETWFNVKAYGTYELGSVNNEIWSMEDKLYRLCFTELPLDVKQEVIESSNLDLGCNV